MADGKRRWAFVAALVAALIAALLVWWRATSGGRVDPDGGELAAPDGARPAAPATAPEAAPRGMTAGRTEEPIRLVSATVEEIEADAVGGFEGRVIDFGTGLGVAGADLTFAAGGATATVTSDAGGGFRWDPAEPGEYAVAVVTADGYLPYAPELGQSPIRLRARRGVRVRGVTVYLTPAIDYRATVVDPDGAPVAGARVELLRAATGERALAPIQDTYTSGDDGTFGFHAPDFAVLEASHDDFAPGRAVVDGDVQVTHELTIELRPKGARPFGAASIAGRVVAADGAPVAGARLGLVNAPLSTAVSGPDGGFELTGVADGSYMLTATHDELAPAQVRVVSGARDLTITLGPGAVVRGTVVGASGEAVPAFTVVVLRRFGPLQSMPVARASVFDADGAFEVGGLAPGEHEVVATAYGFAPSAPVEVDAAPPADARPVEVKLSAGGTVFGAVTDRDSGAPLARARVVLEGLLGVGASAAPTVLTVLSDDAGEFELAGIPPGMQSIRVHAFKHHSRIISNLEVVEGGRIGPLAVDLKATAPGEEPKLELAGIGVAIRPGDDGLVIERLIPGGGAAEAGLVQGDVITAVERQPVTDLGFEGSLQRIRGPEGTTVRLTIRKASSADPVEVLVPRRRIRS